MFLLNPRLARNLTVLGIPLISAREIFGCLGIARLTGLVINEA
jgi:hypothetical protein